jgi:hypothetical protein
VVDIAGTTRVVTIIIGQHITGVFLVAVSVRYSLKSGAAAEAAAVHAAVCLVSMVILVNTISTLFVLINKV